MPYKHNKCEFKWKSGIFITSPLSIDYKGDKVEFYNIELMMWLYAKIALFMGGAKVIE